MFIKITLLLVFFAIMIGIGVYTRKHATDVNGFVLGRRTRVMTQHIDAKTMPDFFGKRYESNALRITASIITFIFLEQL